MIETVVQDRNIKLEEYLQLMRLMAFELDRAMKAIGDNSLQALEDSIANQQVFSDRLGELAEDLRCPAPERPLPLAAHADRGLMAQIGAASEALQSLNRRYSALLKHSSHSVAMMVSLFSSFQGKMQEDSGVRWQQHTWSCRI
jgi:hypothetical protein